MEKQASPDNEVCLFLILNAKILNVDIRHDFELKKKLIKSKAKGDVLYKLKEQ